MALERDGFEELETLAGTIMDSAISDYMIKHSLVTVDRIEDIGIRVPTFCNGSCGVDAFRISSWYAGMVVPTVYAEGSEEWTPADRAADLLAHRRGIRFNRQMIQCTTRSHIVVFVATETSTPQLQ